MDRWRPCAGSSIGPTRSRARRRSPAAGAGSDRRYNEIAIRASVELARPNLHPSRFDGVSAPSIGSPECSKVIPPPLWNADPAYPRRFDAAHFVFRNPWNPLASAPFGGIYPRPRSCSRRMTRRYGEPTFGLNGIERDRRRGLSGLEDVVWSRPFCNLLRLVPAGFPAAREQPKPWCVAPMSGGCATLLRGTSRRSCPISTSTSPIGRTRSWSATVGDVRSRRLHRLPPRHARATRAGGSHARRSASRPFPLLATVALMEANADPEIAAGVTLMGGPIDTRRSPTEVNKLAERRGVESFRATVCGAAPFPYAGFGREVYPGFLQLSGFMAMKNKTVVAERPSRSVQPPAYCRRQQFGRKASRLLRRVPRGDRP